MKSKKLFRSYIFYTLVLRVLFISFLFFGFTFLDETVRAQQPVNSDLRAQPQQPLRRQIVPAEMLELQLVTVPRLVGSRFNPENVSQILDRYGLRPGNAISVETIDNVGIILTQSPAPRQQVRPGTAIDITYGIEIRELAPNQPQNVIVPNYVGSRIGEVF